MRYAILAVPFALAACAGMKLPSPGDVSGNPQITARLAEFCAADFVDGNTAALREWVMIFNLVAPLVGQEPIDTAALTQREAVQTLLQVRSAVCLATQPLPAPVVVEAVEDAPGTLP
jgi:hypothetical protein